MSESVRLHPPNAAQSPNAAEPPKTSLAETSRIVDQSSRDSFPASDPPAWTPVTGTTSSANVSDHEIEGWRAQGEAPHERAMQWIQHAYDLLDAGKFRAFVNAHLADDVLFQVGADLQLSGRVAVQEWLERQHAASGRSTHRVIAVTAEGNAIVSEANVTYHAEGVAAVQVAEACSFRLRGAHASRVQLYTTGA